MNPTADPNLQRGKPATENDEGAPLFFSSWRRLYAAVVVYLAAFVIVLYLFTEYFQILQ